MVGLLAYYNAMIANCGKYGRVDQVFLLNKGKSGSLVMCDSDEDTALTNHLLDQFSAYYTITVVAVHFFMQWKAHHNQAKLRELAASKA